MKSTINITLLLLLICTAMLACSNVHTFVKDSRFVHVKRGYLLLEKREFDTSYSDDVYLNRLANLENKFSLLFFETKIDTTYSSKQAFLNLIKKRANAVELGKYCSTDYEELIDQYCDTLSVTEKGSIYILPSIVRVVNEKRGIYEENVIAVRINQNESKKIKVRSGRITLVSIEPVLTQSKVVRLMKR